MKLLDGNLEIGPSDHPELLYSAIRDLWHYRSLDLSTSSTVVETLVCMESFFLLSTFHGELERELDPDGPSMTMRLDMGDLELAVVGLGCFTLDHRPDQVGVLIPQVDELLVGFDALRTQLNSY